MKKRGSRDARRLLGALMDLIFPPLCVICGEYLSSGERHLCGSCISQIVKISHPLCTFCGKPFFGSADSDHLCGECMAVKPPFHVARTYGVYGGVLLAAVHLFKYHHRTYLAPVLSELVAGNDWSGCDLRSYDLITPVPLHRRRLYERGYNQALLLCREIGSLWGMPVNDTDLIRCRWTMPQIQLSPKEREKNVRGAFTVVGDGFREKRVLLVDDVYTTGATVAECARTLSVVGPRGSAC